ncbi:SGNH/GDSL hydrolase family protein [Nocardioides speluncae]|uniref:SGNH/GDSL hydrolase family protein n=1 Tax=Nocardioides speluncae TaxID=2670337 RepID=UPI0019812DFC|nr:SGNH/GDSL hydrolase family protein [Nocardioides speluncae]
MRLILLATAVLGCAVLSPLAPAAAADTDTANYVAIGDSYVAGAFTGLPTGQPFGCLRSTGNYPHVLAPKLAPLTLRDVGCSSAKTDHVFAPQTTDGSLGVAPPQLDAATAATRLVTIGLGANDIAISDAFTGCVSLFPIGSPCRDKFASAGKDVFADRIAATAPKIDRVLSAVADKAPAAEILVVGYPSIVPNSGRGCWPAVPITDPDIGYLRDTVKRLNAMLSDRAAAAGATYVDTYTPRIGKDLCAAPWTKWIEGLVPTSPASPFHPNARGEAGLADAVLTTLDRAG